MAYDTFERPSQRSSSPAQSIIGNGRSSSSPAQSIIGNGRSSSFPAISIIGNGRIMVNAPITRILRSEGAARMLLLFDEGQRKIGLAALKKGIRRDDRSYK